MAAAVFDLPRHGSYHKHMIITVQPSHFGFSEKENQLAWVKASRQLFRFTSRYNTVRYTKKDVVMG